MKKKYLIVISLLLTLTGGCDMLNFSSSVDNEIEVTVPKKIVSKKPPQIEEAVVEISKNQVVEEALVSDPFLTAQEEELFKKTAGREVLSNLVVSAIIKSEQGSYAIVNGRVVKEKDLLDSKEVVKIEREKMILSDRQGEYLILLNK